MSGLSPLLIWVSLYLLVHISNFRNIVTKAKNIYGSWKNQHISMARRTILINSTLMSFPVYTLPVQHIPDSILESIAKSDRKFFLHKGSNCSGLPLVAWNRITTDKADGD